MTRPAHLHLRTPGMRRTVAALACAAMGLLGACAKPPGAAGSYGADAPARQAQEAAERDALRLAEPVDTQATYLAVVAQMQEKDLWFASLAHIDALEQRHGRSTESLRLRADALRQTGRVADSAALYRQLVDTPLAAAGWRGLGLLAAADGAFDDAAALLERARQRTPTDAVLLGDLGYAYLRAGRPEAARMPLMQAQQLSPGHPRVLGNLALFFLLQQEQALAEALMEERRLPATTRAAIRAEARRVATQPAAAPAPAPARNRIADDPPVALQPASRLPSLSKGIP